MLGKVEFSSDLNADQLVEAINMTENSSLARTPAATAFGLQPDVAAVSGPTTNSER